MALKLSLLPAAVAFLTDRQRDVRVHPGIREEVHGRYARYRVMTAALVAHGRADLWFCNPQPKARRG